MRKDWPVNLGVSGLLVALLGGMAVLASHLAALRRLFCEAPTH
jgi:hypothetical protein